MHIPKTQGGGGWVGGILSTNLVLIKVASEASAGPGRSLEPLQQPQQPLGSFCELHWAPALMVSPLLPICLRPSVVMLKSLLMVGLLALFLSITLWNPIHAVCMLRVHVCATHVSVTDQCVPAWVKSHPAIASTFLYRNNIIVNYLWPNLFCYNFPVE